MSEKLGINVFTFDEICDSQDFEHEEEFVIYEGYYDLYQELEKVKNDRENWKARGDFEFDRAEQMSKLLDQKQEALDVIADRLRDRDEDCSRLCKILIANGLGNLIEVEE